MRKSLIVVSALAAAVVAISGCAANPGADEEEGSSTSQAAELTNLSSTRYQGEISVGDATYTIKAEVTAVVERQATQIVDCWAHASNDALCTVFFDRLPGRVTTSLSIVAADGEVLSQTTDSIPIAVGGGYLSKEESASYLMNRSARPKANVSTYVSRKGVNVALPGGTTTLRVAQGYGMPSDIEIPATLSMQSPSSSSFEDNSSSATRLSRQSFKGRLHFNAPKTITFDVGVVTNPQDFMGATVPVVLVNDRLH